MFWQSFIVALLTALKGVDTEFSTRICEPITIEMCRGIGYNETSFPNIVGNDLQTDVEINLQTFSPLIDYMCSTQLKLFLCSAYVPMCTSKVPMSIGPCRSLCMSVRSRCLPVLQGFGFPWPPALECNRFPKENNHETMCMEGPGEALIHLRENNVYPGPLDYNVPVSVSNLDCPGVSSSNLYVKLQRSGQCALRCDADVLFIHNEKRFVEEWVATLSYVSIGFTIVTTLSMILDYDSEKSVQILMPLFWCHAMVSVSWAVRFVFGRTATSCGNDPLLPNDLHLLVDGLSNYICTTTFILRYLFGMAACAWWAILCLGWYRDLRLRIPEAVELFAHGNMSDSRNSTNQTKIRQKSSKSTKYHYITQNNFARFAAWALPSFQTLVVIIARFVDADELLGACYVGNQSETGLQFLVATPLFCYWIFGSMNLLLGFIVHFRNKRVIKNLKTSQLLYQLHSQYSGVSVFFFIYSVLSCLILVAVVYEFVNIDLWLTAPSHQNVSQELSTPLWPYMTRVIMELILGIITCGWVISRKISSVYRKKTVNRLKKQPLTSLPNIQILQNRQNLNVAYSSISYQTVHHHASNHRAAGSLQLSQMPSYISESRSCTPHLYANKCEYINKQSVNHQKNDETLL